MPKLYDTLEKAIVDSQMSEAEKQAALTLVLQDKDKKANILITGATGCGKSSTINALFKTEKAKVGTGVDPETMEIKRFDLGNLTLWDSPGLGDGAEADKKHSIGIISKIDEKDDSGNLLIDVVLVILDGSGRDLGTSYELINKVIIPHLQDNKRLLIGINQADQAMKGRNWDFNNHKPELPLQKFLDEKADSVKRRIKEGTGVDVDPICYSAGFKEEGKEQEPSYNLSKLLFYIIDKIPEEKRIQVFEELNDNPDVWASDDGRENYKAKTAKSVGKRIIGGLNGAAKGAALGAAIGSFVPILGNVVGAAVGGLLGFFGGLFD